MKLLSYAIPCYNSAEYMDNCIVTLLESGNEEDIEILIIDDGSTKDTTAVKAEDWAAKYPTIIKAIHQKNGGHGEAVNTGLRNASGLYYKVVDSDDWLDVNAAKKMIATLRGFVADESPVDLLVCNYVYEHVEDDTRNIVSYVGVLPENRTFTWDEVGSFRPSQNLLMHSVVYRTEILRDCKIELPKHTFYVDNIFVYVPLPCVETIYYLNVDLYRYYIGREDQSVNEKVMISRIDQQFRVTRIMIDSVKIPEDVPIKRLENYMVGYLTMMMTICSILAILSDRVDKLELRDGIWDYLKASDEKLYRRIRHGFLGMGSTLPGPLGRSTAIKVYHLAQRLYKFN